MQGVRIYEMPACKMVSSGMGMFGEEKFDLFEQWFSSQKRSMFPRDFLYWAGEGFMPLQPTLTKKRIKSFWIRR